MSKQTNNSVPTISSSAANAAALLAAKAAAATVKSEIDGKTSPWKAFDGYNLPVILAWFAEQGIDALGIERIATALDRLNILNKSGQDIRVMEITDMLIEMDAYNAHLAPGRVVNVRSGDASRNSLAFTLRSDVAQRAFLIGNVYIRTKLDHIDPKSGLTVGRRDTIHLLLPYTAGGGIGRDGRFASAAESMLRLLVSRVQNLDNTVTTDIMFQGGSVTSGNDVLFSKELPVVAYEAGLELGAQMEDFSLIKTTELDRNRRADNRYRRARGQSANSPGNVVSATSAGPQLAGVGNISSAARQAPFNLNA